MYYTILLLLFAGTCFVAGNPAADSAHEIKSSIDHVHSVVLNHHVRLPFFHDNGARHKRQADWYSDDSYLDESTLCLLRCTNQLKAATRPYSTSVTDLDDENDMTKPNFNLTRFTKICEAMRPPIQCYNRCPSSSLMTQMRDMLDPLKYMCVDRYEDIKNNARCMHKLAAVTNAQCVPRCREFESALNRTRQFARRPYLRYLYSADDVREMLSGTCQYIKCGLDCSVPLTRRVCGDTAAELVTSITQKLMASLQNYDSLAANGQFLPEECRRLARPSESRDEADRDQQAQADEYVDE